MNLFLTDYICSRREIFLNLFTICKYTNYENVGKESCLYKQKITDSKFMKKSGSITSFSAASSHSVKIKTRTWTLKSISNIWIFRKLGSLVCKYLILQKFYRKSNFLHNLIFHTWYTEQIFKRLKMSTHTISDPQ